VSDHGVFKEREALSYLAALEMASGKMKFNRRPEFADGFFAERSASVPIPKFA
jgi:hypothetical protein